jgi:hypothetical protein
MDASYHRFSELFQQLGLPHDPAAIRAFIQTHSPLAPDVRIEDAPFWSPAQAALLREKLLDDADWSEVTDQLSLALRNSMSGSGLRVQAICLCASWCSVCRDFVAQYQSAKDADQSVSYEWLDVENDVQRLGDVEVENFPCLLIAVAGEPVFFGPISPNRATLARLIQSAAGMQPLAADYPDRSQLTTLLQSAPTSR